MDDPEFKHYLNDLSIVPNLFVYLVKIIANYQKELIEVLEMYIIFSKQTVSEKFKICIKTNQVSIWHLMILYF